MPDMSELHDYISGLTGKEVDAAILMLMSKYVSNFNGRVGPTIQPQKGDYDASKITIPGIAIPENLEDLEFGDTSQTLLAQILNILSSLKARVETLEEGFIEEVLWEGPIANQAAGFLFPLTKSAFDFDFIRFYYGHRSPSWCSINEIQDYNVELSLRPSLGATSVTNGAFYLWQYDNRYSAFALQDEKTLKKTEINGADYTIIRQISGIKFSNYVYKQLEQEET